METQELLLRRRYGKRGMAPVLLDVCCRPWVPNRSSRAVTVLCSNGITSTLTFTRWRERYPTATLAEQLTYLRKCGPLTAAFLAERLAPWDRAITSPNKAS